jgi:oligoendopeptidase F
MTHAQKFLFELNSEYLKLHQNYEELFWISHMGDHSVDLKKTAALQKLDTFRSNKDLREEALSLLTKSDTKIKSRLQIWIDFFEQYQMSIEASGVKKEIDALEVKILQKRSKRVEGYIDTKTDKFVEASSAKMRTLMSTSPDEQVRKACFEGREKLALLDIEEYVELVKLRNKFAKAQGCEDFYDYKLRKIDKTDKETLFSLLEDISENTKQTFINVRELEKEIPGLRKPWNFNYLMSGDFTQEEDKYFQFDEAVMRWGKSFSALGIDFKNGTLKLDLLDRKGKWNNGFCHWPKLVNYNTGKREPGSANFTCNVVAGQVGSGFSGYNTLFHEGGHAAHFLNTNQKEVCLNHEYAPMTASWAETHSMFIDTMFSSIEWKMRYAKDDNGQPYPFELFERKVNKLNILRPQAILSIIFVSTFEKEVYELKAPTAENIIKIAKKNYKKFNDLSGDSLLALNIPHIYSWESSCSYHGYGMAQIALTQWRHYFYKKYGYIVDNPAVGIEMQKAWQWGASKSFDEATKIATGKKLSSQALIKEINQTPKQVINTAKLRIKKMESVRGYTKPVKLNAKISMVHGKKEISNNKASFEEMALKYGKWVKKMSQE